LLRVTDEVFVVFVVVDDDVIVVAKSVFLLLPSIFGTFNLSFGSRHF